MENCSPRCFPSKDQSPSMLRQVASTVVPKFATEEEKACEGLWSGLEGSISLLPHPIGQNWAKEVQKSHLPLCPERGNLGVVRSHPVLSLPISSQITRRFWGVITTAFDYHYLNKKWKGMQHLKLTVVIASVLDCIFSLVKGWPSNHFSLPQQWGKAPRFEWLCALFQLALTSGIKNLSCPCFGHLHLFRNIAET